MLLAIFDCKTGQKIKISVVETKLKTLPARISMHFYIYRGTLWGSIYHK